MWSRNIGSTLFKVNAFTTILDSISEFNTNQTNVLPVFDEKKYLGLILMEDLIEALCKFPFFQNQAFTMVVRVATKKYSMNQITKIVESNNGKLLGAFVSKMKNDVVQVTLKIGNASLNEIIQTFRRYSYNIVSGHEDDSYNQSLKERSDYLNKYLNM